MKKIFGKSLIALVLAMTMIVGTCMSVMAAAPAGSKYSESKCSNYKGREPMHLYSFGTTYDIEEDTYVDVYVYTPAGGGYPASVKNLTSVMFVGVDEQDWPDWPMSVDEFEDCGTYAEGWYCNTGNWVPCNGTHGATTPEITCSSEEAPAPAPAEPPTPDEELRAAEEEALPLVMIETDKSKTTNEEISIVPDKTYNLSAYVTTRGFVSALDKIAKANPKAKKVTIFTSKPFTFNKNIVESINKGGKDVEYYFKHEGDIYSVDIPANVDSSKVLEKNGHAGPLYVGQQLSTTKLRKKKLF